MSMIETFLNELEQEAVTTRKMLERIPDDKFGWKPHEKSMNIKQLSTHIAEMPGWINRTLDSDGMDFQKDTYAPADVNTTEELLNYFEQTQASCVARLKKATDAELDGRWVFRNGDTVTYDAPKAAFVRVSLNQVTHHRAQLGVYLRLLDIPIPGSYGPSADEQVM